METKLMNPRWNNRLVAALAVALPAFMYFKTLARTVPFWDAGEFIAVSKILGVPHPPGTPLYVLIAHLFGKLPFWNYATRINFLSEFMSLVSVLCTYLAVQKITQMLLKTTEPTMAVEGGGSNGANPTHFWLSCFAGLTAAWFTAFSNSYWDSSVETEVYCGASALMLFSIWMGMNWYERHGEDRNERRLLLIWYVLCVGIGIHLGGFIVLPAIVLFALVADWRRSWWMGLGVGMIGAWFTWTSFWQDKMHVQSDTQAVALSAAGAVGVCLLLHVLLPKHLRSFVWLTMAGFVVGITVHAYLVIRANLGPIINEADPSGWDALWDVFTRKQYAPVPITQRNADWTYQLDYMFFRYFKDQFVLGAPWRSHPDYHAWPPMLAVLGTAVPLILGEFGRLWHLIKGRTRRDAWWSVHLGVWAVAIVLYQFLNLHALAIFLVFAMHSVDLLLAMRAKQAPFVLVQTFFLMTTLGLSIYLNFKNPQVRERDYFFLWGYQAYTFWIGLGVAGVIFEGLRALRLEAKQKLLVPVLGMLALVMPLTTCAHYYFEKDRTGNDVARDYAFNLLQPLPPNAILFTNGDNDTFPLWYLQEVEEIRKDVRVVNLSLLNTTWYIRQMRDIEPRVPITMTDAEINSLEPYRDTTGAIIMVKDVMVDHIVRTTGAKKPLYMAVTVPETMGLDNRFVLEGLSYHIMSQNVGGPIVNVPLTRHLIYDVFRYKGLLAPDGTISRIPFKDENATRLAGNYAAAHLRLAYTSHDQRDYKAAFEELDRAEKISTDFAGIPVTRGMFYQDQGDSAHALEAFLAGLKRFPDHAELNYRAGILYALRGRLAEGSSLLQRAHQEEPDNSSIAMSLFTLMLQMRQVNQADQMMRAYMDRHPEDTRAHRLYNQFLSETGQSPLSPGSAGSGAAVPPSGLLPPSGEP